MPDHRIAEISLDERSIVRWNADIEHERKVAIFDLLEENNFEPKIALTRAYDGPYKLHLGIADGRLLFKLDDTDDAPLAEFKLPVGSLRRLIREYFAICDSYYQAIKTATPTQIEAIDMGRRGLHNQGSEQLQDLLADKAEIDFTTARRLFTLVCVLHLKA